MIDATIYWMIKAPVWELWIVSAVGIGVVSAYPLVKRLHK